MVDPGFDKDLLHRLPLPLAQLYRDAHNAPTSPDRHQTAYYLWEAALKLLATVVVVSYAERAEHDPKLVMRLRAKLQRPTLGLWWEVARSLLPSFARGAEPGLAEVSSVLLGPACRELPYASGLYAHLLDVQDKGGRPQLAVPLKRLFDELLKHRTNLAHGTFLHRPSRYHEELGAALLGGVPELLGKLDVLGGGKLIAVDAVRRGSSGRWLVESTGLTGETPGRLDPRQYHDAPDVCPGRVYLELAPRGAGADGGATPPPLRSLHPLVLFDPQARRFLFYNRSEPGSPPAIAYHAYTGEAAEDRPFEPDPRAVLVGILGLDSGGGPLTARPAEGPMAPEGEAEGPSEAPDAGPQRIGGYRVVRELGHGAHGVVYEVEDEDLGRHDALKCLSAAGKEYVTRFQREMHTLGKVGHPHLIQIYTWGNQGGILYYVMELVRGATLASVFGQLRSRTESDASRLDLSTWDEALSMACTGAGPGAGGPRAEGGDDGPPRRPRADGPFAGSAARPLAGQSYVRRAVEMVRQVAEAAHALHEAGVVHRDIKPSNIMLAADGSKATLMDLGLAHLVDAGDTSDPLTREFRGTLRYASPEQVLSAHQVDRRSDVYSLGATLWELICLRPIFDESGNAPVHEIMTAVAVRDPGSIRARHPGISRDLELIVRKCLEKDANRRYPTAAELAEDLRRWLDGEAVSVRPPTLGYLARRSLHRHRRAILLASPLLATWLVGAPILAVVFSWQWRKEKALRRQVEGARVEAADTVESFFTNVSQANLINTPRMEPLRLKFLTLAVDHLKALQKTQADDPHLAARVARARYDVGRMLEGLQRTDEARKDYEEALAVQVALLSQAPGDLALRRERAETGRRLGLCYPGSRNEAARRVVAEARETLLGATNAAKSPPTASEQAALDLDLAKTYIALAYLDKQAGTAAAFDGPGAARADYETARRLLDRLIQRSKTDDPLRPEYDHLRAQLSVNVGNLERDAGRIEGARSAYQAAAAIWEKRLPSRRDDTGSQQSHDPQYLAYRLNLNTALANLATIEIARGRLDDAEGFARRSSEVGDDLVADFPYPEHLDLKARAYFKRAEVALQRRWRAERRGDPSEAARWSERAGACGKSARTIFERLLRADPKNPEFRDGLGSSDLCLAAAAAGEDAAVNRALIAAELKPALEIYEELTRTRPEKPYYRQRLAIGRRMLGDAHAALAIGSWEQGEPAAADQAAEADAAYRKADSDAEALIGRHKQIVIFASPAGQILAHHARFLNKARDFARDGAVLTLTERARAAAALADRCLEILRGVRLVDGSDDRARLYLAYALQEKALAEAHLGEDRRAARDAEAALQEAEARAAALKEPDADRPTLLLYNLAATYAQASMAALADARRDPARGEDAERFSARALELLEELDRCEPFADPGRRRHLAADPDFRPLAAHARFRRLAGAPASDSRASDR